MLYYNGIDPTSQEALPAIQPGQKIYLRDPYKLTASRVKAKAPVEFSEYGPQGQEKLHNYALALRQGKIKMEDIPEPFRVAVGQEFINIGRDKVSDQVFNVGSNIAMFLANPLAYTAGTVAQKGTAYAADAISGRNEYGLGDALGFTPVMGREYAAENPGKSFAVDAVTGVVGGSALRNIPNIANPA